MDSGAERRYGPTPQQLRRMRQQGVIPRSAEAFTLAVLLATLLVLRTGAGAMLERSRTGLMLVSGALGRADDLVRSEGLGDLVAMAVAPMALPLLGIMLAGMLAAIASGLLQFGPNFAPEVLLPRVSRLDQRERFLGVRALVELGKSIAKIALSVGVLATVLYAHRDGLGGLAFAPVDVGATLVVDISFEIAWKLLGVYMLVTLLDVLYSRRAHAQRMLMTRADYERDIREIVQGPEMAKTRIFGELIRGSQRLEGEEDVDDSTGVLTNPTHVAVAFHYDPEIEELPYIVAKGEGLAAARIRARARAARVPLIEDPPLARELYRRCEVGEPVPADERLWLALGAVIKEIYRLYPERKPAALAELSV